jgi:hypothetical protein
MNGKVNGKVESIEEDKEVKVQQSATSHMQSVGPDLEIGVGGLKM